MDFPAPVPLAITALTLGLAMWGFVVVVLRWVQRSGSVSALSYLAWPMALVAERETHNAGVLVGESGRLLFLNARARALFSLDEAQTPSLLQMARSMRPSETLEQLLLHEGRSLFNIGDLRVEGISVQVPGQRHQAPQTVVMLRELEQAAEISALDEETVRAVTTLTDISRAITGSLDLDKTYDAIFVNMGRVFQYNIAEINLWNPTTAKLTPARHAGDRDYPRALVQKGGGAYELDDSYSGWLARQRQPLLITDVDKFTGARPKLMGSEFKFQSFLGVPMLVGEELVGTLEMVSYKPNAYKQSDVTLLEVMARQAALSIRNAQQYAEQQRRVAELSGVAEITRAIEATSDPRELYGRLSADIGRFMQVQLVAFLDYQAAEEALVGQPPFHGLPDIVAAIYRLPIPPGSPAEQFWQTTPHWLANDVATDPQVDLFDLRNFFETAGIRSTLLAPITLGGRRLGAVQVSNKINGTPFTPDDVRLLLIFAGQSGAILDNARLVRESRIRAEQAEGMRLVAAATAAGTDIDATTRQVMQLANHLIAFDQALVVLLDEARGELVPHAPSLLGVAPEDLNSLRLSTDDPAYAISVTQTRQPFVTDQAEADRRITGFYRQLVERYQVESAIVVPLIVGERSIGEVLVAASRPRAFTQSDVQLLATIASQMASAIERVRLYAATDSSLQRRVDQLTALTRISRELNQTLELDHILNLVHDEAVRTTRATCGTIVLFALGQAERPVARRIGDEHLGRTLTMLEADVASGEHAKRRVRGLRPDSPQTPHDGVRAALVVPITVLGQVAGLIHLHTANLEGFDEAAEEAAIALAAQTAIAVENTRRFEEQKKRGELLRRRADQLAQLFEISRSVRSDKPLGTNLEAIAFGLQEAVGFNVVMINVLNPQTRRYKSVAAAGLPLAMFETVSQTERSWDDLARILRPEFRISQSYFLPHEKAASLTAQLEFVAPMPPTHLETPVLSNAWDPNDMLITPLRGSRQETLGLIAVDAPRDGRRPDRNTIEIIEIFANQAAQAIENSRLYEAAERRAAQLLALHRVIETATASTDRAQVWQNVVTNLLGELPVLDVGVLALLGEDNRLEMRGRAGKLGPHVDLKPLLASPNPLLQVIKGGPMLVLGIGDTEWALNPFVMAAELRSFVAVPIMSQNKAAGALLVGSQNPRTPFTTEDLDVFTILANQLGASLDSARLEADIRRRAAQLAALVEVSQSITGILRVEEIIEALLAPRGLQAVVPYDSVTVWLRQGERLRIAAARGFENDGERLGLTVEIADSLLFAEMAQKRAPILAGDVRQDPRFPAGEFQPTQSWLGVPLVSKASIIGALVLDKVEPHFYTPAATQIIMAFANQAAVALENARLFAESEQRAHELNDRSQRLALLNRVSALIGGATQLNQVYSVTLAEIMKALKVDRALMVAYQDGQPVLALQQPAQPVITDIWNPALDRVRETLAPLSIEDIQQESLIAAARVSLHARGVHSMLVVPLVVGNQMVAALQVEEMRPRHFSLGEIELVQTFANQAAVAVQNARLHDETQNRLGELVTINHISRALSAAINREQLYQVISDQVTAILGVDNLYLVLHDTTRDLLTFALLISMGERRTLEPIAVAGLAGHILKTGQPLLLRGPNAEARAQELGVRIILTNKMAKSYLGVPLRLGERVVGVMAIQDLERYNSFDESHERILSTVAAQVAVALENSRLFDETQTQLRELATMNAISQAISSTLNVKELYHILGEKIAGLTPANAIQLALYDAPRGLMEYPILIEDGEWHVAPAQPPGGFSGYILRTGESLLLAGEALRQKTAEIGAVVLAGQVAKAYLGVPLKQGDEIIGVLALQDTQHDDVFTPSHLRIFATIAAQVAVAVQNARLFAQTQEALTERTRAETGMRRRNQELEALNRVVSAVTSVLDLQAMLQTTAKEMVQLFNAYASGIAVLDPDGQHLTVLADYSSDPNLPSPVGLKIPVAGNIPTLRVMETRATVVIDDALNNPLSGPMQVIFKERATSCLMIVPLLARGEVIGTIGIDTNQPDRTFTQEEVFLAETIAGQVSTGIGNARFAQDLERRVAARTADLERERQRVETLLLITTELSSSLDLDRVLARALQLVTDAVSAPRGSIFLLDLESDQLIYRAALGRKRPLLPGGEPAPFKRHEGLVGWVIRNRQSVVIDDLDTDARWKAYPSSTFPAKSALAVPLMANEDALGALILLSAQPTAFDDDQLRLVAAAANQVGAAINNAELYRLIRDQAERLGGMLRGQQVEATKIRAILEGIADGVFVTDANGQIILFNLACERILRLDRDSVMGRPANEFIGIYGSAGKEWLTATVRWSSEPGHYRPGDFVSQQIKLDTGQVVSVHLSPVIANEEYLGSVSVIRDITREVEVDRLKSDFVTNVSHELRTPMTSIKGYADLLLFGAAGPLTTDQARFLEVIKGNADRLSMLVDDLLDISRIESGRVQLVMRPVNLQEVVMSVISTLRGRVDEENKPMTLLSEIPADLPPVWGDRERLTQILINLGDNAFSYSPPDSQIVFAATVDDAKQEAVLTVTDNGIGMAPEEQKRLFVRFYRAENALVMAKAGTGLGLSIARQMAEMHNGRLWLVRSAPQVGSTFALAVPLAASVHPAEPSGPAA